MQRIPGKQMNEMEFAPEEMQQVHQALPEMAAKMHRVTNKGYGYPQNGLHDTWTKALYSMAEAVIKDAQAVGKSCENGEKMLVYIKKHASVLDRASCCMVNFDLWDANIICQRTSNGILSVLIDPERGYWGDPVMDFLCREFDKPIKEKKNSLRAYNMSAVHPIMVGRDEEIRYAFAQAYLGIIMEVERYYRYIPGDEGWTRNDNVCQFLFGQAFASLETL